MFLHFDIKVPSKYNITICLDSFLYWQETLCLLSVVKIPEHRSCLQVSDIVCFHLSNLLKTRDLIFQDLSPKSGYD